MKIEVTVPTEQDYDEYRISGLNAEACLDGRVKLICEDDSGHRATSFMMKDMFERLGLEYIKQHSELRYSHFGDIWYLNCSQNDWHNNLTRNPEKVIKVQFEGIEEGTGREIYRGIETKRYYLREVSRREPFAKWYVCGTRRVPEDGNEPRPNLIFQFGEQQEKVRYDDWNGVAAYSNTFNRDFRKEV